MIIINLSQAANNASNSAYKSRVTENNEEQNDAAIMLEEEKQK